MVSSFHFYLVVLGKVVVESVYRLLFLVDTQPRTLRAGRNYKLLPALATNSPPDCLLNASRPLLRSRSIVGYTFRRHKLRFMSNAKLRTTTLLRYGSSSQKSAAHIFGNPDCILLPVCFQSCARLWRTILQIVFHTNLLIFNIEKVADFSLSPT